jgi:outer membrane protein assembly factor BamB
MRSITVPHSMAALAVAMASTLTQVAAPTCRGAERGDWPCFRGPDRSGVSDDTSLPLRWSDSENVVWKTRLPGAGASSPVTFGDRIYLTCYSGYGLDRAARGEYRDLKLHVVCLNRADGRILWNESFPNTVPTDHYGDHTNQHGYATSTPAVDETGVYVFFGTTGARAYGHDGGLKWERSCGRKYTNYGSSASPVLFEDRVIINASIEDRAVVALDKQDGRQLWRVSTSGLAYSTPLLIGGPTPQLVFHLGEEYEGGSAKPTGLAAVDPRTGDRLWEHVAPIGMQNSSPIAGGGLIYTMGGYHAHAIRPAAGDDSGPPRAAWDIKRGTGIGTPVLYQGHLYWTNEENGTAYCADAQTGSLAYERRLEPRPGKIYASGIIADGKLYYVSRESGVYVLAAKPQFELLAHNTLESDPSVFNATPAVSRGELLLRSDTHLYCLGVK